MSVFVWTYIRTFIFPKAVYHCHPFNKSAQFYLIRWSYLLIVNIKKLSNHSGLIKYMLLQYPCYLIKNHLIFLSTKALQHIKPLPSLNKLIIPFNFMCKCLWLHLIRFIMIWNEVQNFTKSHIIRNYSKRESGILYCIRTLSDLHYQVYTVLPGPSH